MMPIIANTQIPAPTQVSLVATPLPGTSALRVLPDMVSPSMPDAKIGPDAKGNGIYTAPVSASVVNNPASAPLTTLIPASFTNNSASLGPVASFAAQLMAQDESGAAALFPVYEEMMAASQVKYKPSNAMPQEPATNNLYAQFLSEQQQGAQTVAVMQQAPKQEMAQQMAPQVSSPKIFAASEKKSSNDNAAAASTRGIAGRAYAATSVRNHAWLGAKPPVEAADAIAN